jgi:predicted ribosomally synthesized peptide with nif11-like leader
MNRGDTVSATEIERFNRDVKADTVLRDQLKQRSGTPADIVAFAAERGYSFSVDEANAYAKATGSMELDDAQLDAVAGGSKTKAGEGVIFQVFEAP